MEKRIYTRRLAAYLFARGFKPIRTEPDARKESRNSGKRNKMNYPHYGSNNLPMLSIKNFGKGGSKFE